MQNERSTEKETEEAFFSPFQVLGSGFTLFRNTENTVHASANQTTHLLLDLLCLAISSASLQPEGLKWTFTGGSEWRDEEG